MANASISGLVSGLDTATIISQLMQVEAQPQTMLKTRMSSEQTSLSSLQSLNSKLLTIATKAGDLAKTAGWSPFTATSSSDKVTATVTSGATASSFSFTVKQTAQPHRVAFDSAALTTRVTATGSTAVHLTASDGTVTSLETGDGTLDGLVKAINGSGAGVRATTLQLSDGTSRVIVQSEKTGAASNFTLTNADGTALALGSTATAGQDALITVGTDELKSSTNTFSGTVSGIDLTLAASTAAGTTVDITVSRDSKTMTDSVKALVDAANAVLTDIASLTSYNSATKKGGALAGDTTLRSLRQELLSSVATGIDGRSLADLGIQLDRSGAITFDAKKFEAAYTADPTGTANRFAGTASWDDPANTGSATLAGFTWRTAPGDHVIDSTAGTIDGEPATVSGSLMTGKSGTRADGLAVTVSGTTSGTLVYHQGFAARLAAIAGRASDSAVGTVTAAIKGRTDAIDSLEDKIADWDVRLDLRRETLTRQYAALEVALGKLQNQSSWLAGQIAGLPTMSSGS
jgi:flagellar hook-associated protein 2